MGRNGRIELVSITRRHFESDLYHATIMKKTPIFFWSVDTKDVQVYNNNCRLFEILLKLTKNNKIYSTLGSKGGGFLWIGPSF